MRAVLVLFAKIYPASFFFSLLLWIFLSGAVGFDKLCIFCLLLFLPAVLLLLSGLLHISGNASAATFWFLMRICLRRLNDCMLFFFHLLLGILQVCFVCPASLVWTNTEICHDLDGISGCQRWDIEKSPYRLWYSRFSTAFDDPEGHHFGWPHNHLIFSDNDDDLRR